MKKFILLALALVLSTANAGDPPAPKDINIRADLTDSPDLGRGYNSTKDSFSGTCVMNDLRRVDKAVGSLDMKLQSSQDDASASLGMEAGGRYRTGATETSASATMAQSVVKTGYTVNFVYKFDSSYSESFKGDRVSPTPEVTSILERWKKDPVVNTREWFMSCGDEYVNSARRAARILVNLSVSFASESEASSFASKFAFSSPTTDINAKIEAEAKKVSKKTTMSFYSVQLGGYAGYAGKAICPDIITHAPTGGKNKTPAAAPVVNPGTNAGERNECATPIIQCGYGNFPYCIQMLKDIVAYSANNFANQVENPDGSYKNYATAQVHVRPYTEGTGDFPMRPSEESERMFLQEVQNIHQSFEAYFHAWVFASRLIYAKTPRLSPGQSDKMVKIESDLHKLVSKITTKIEECYLYGYGQCHQNSQDVTGLISAAYDDLRSDVGDDFKGINKADKLEGVISSLTKPETFAQYCDLASETSPDFQSTVNSIKKWAQAHEKDVNGKDIDFDKEEDTCLALETYLAPIEEMSLSGLGGKYPVASLEPFTPLKNLRVLQLSDQRIKNIAQLSLLPNLQSINLDRDIVSDVCPLAKLPGLTKLSVRNNQIRDVSCLGKAPVLASLDARGNSSSLVCPIANQAGCKLADFTKTVTSVERGDNCGVHVGSSAVPLDGRVLVAGGATPANGVEAMAVLDLYDRDGCRPTGFTLNVPRANFTMTKLNDGRVLIAGGYTDSLEIIDPAKSFRPRRLTQTLLYPRSFHSATLLDDGRVLIIGGYSTDDTNALNTRLSNALASFEIINPVTEQREQWGTLAIPRAEHVATKLPGGKILVTGGYSYNRNQQQAEMIDLSKVSPQNPHELIPVVVDRMAEGRFGHSATLFNGDTQVLIAGGYVWKTEEGKAVQTIGATDSLEIFDIRSQRFLPVDDKLTQARGGMSTVTLPDHKILFFGGNNAGKLFNAKAALGNADERALVEKTTLATIDVFDPANSGIYTIGDMAKKRSQFAVAPLSDSLWLIVGGMGTQTSMVTGELLVYKP